MADSKQAAPKPVVTTATVRFRNVMAGLRETRKRAQAAKYLKEHIARFNGSVPEAVLIDPKLNEYIMKNSVKAGKEVKVEITKNAGMINVRLFGANIATAAVQKQAQPAPARTEKQGFPQESKVQAASQPTKPAEATPSQKKEESKATKAEAATKAAKGDQQAKAQEKKQKFSSNKSQPEPADTKL